MEFSFIGTLQKILVESGFAAFADDPRSLVMILIACVLLYLGIVKKFEPLLLVPIAFGVLMANFPLTGLLNPPDGNGNVGLFWVFYQGVQYAVYPSIIFLGIGAMTDFGPLIARPSSMLLGAAAQFGIFSAFLLALWLNLDGSWTAVVWGHLLWVMPWMLFILQPAWQRIDSRLILIAQTLSWSRAKIFFYVKCPLMLRPTLIAFAVGFSVSIAQYMPTLWLGAGRFPTLTTEAVALSSGGSNGIFAAQALWQLLLPLIIFALTALVAKWVGYVRQGLR